MVAESLLVSGRVLPSMVSERTSSEQEKYDQQANPFLDVELSSESKKKIIHENLRRLIGAKHE